MVSGCALLVSSFNESLNEPVQTDEIFFDATCVKADVHVPVDWVL